MSLNVSLSRLHYPVRALGPGKRIGLWVQGCSVRCSGCLSADTWRRGTGRVAVATVLERLSSWSHEADGLTVSGGEPLDQPEALAELLRGWRRLSDASVLIFTGYEWATAQSWFSAHPGLADAVIAGPYDAAAGQTLALRGSDNQTLHILTRVGEPFRAFERARSDADRRLDVMFDPAGTVWFAGIPAAGDFDALAAVLERNGHRVAISSDRAVV